VVLEPVSSIVILALAGMLIASLGAMTGLGGGFLCVPFLLVAWGLGKEEAVLTSLTMILANSTSSSITYIRARMVDLGTVLVLALPAIPALFVGYELLKNMEASVFDLLFSILLISVTTYILITRSRKRSKEEDPEGGRLTEGNQKRRFKLHFTIPLAFLAGIASSAFGIGGGAILMPLQVGLLKMNVKKAIATSMFLLMLLTGFRVIIISRGGFDPYIALPLAAGALIGAQIGALIVKRIKGQVLLYILSSFLLFIAIYMGAGALIDILG
jgi:hypothetical protein